MLVDDLDMAAAIAQPRFHVVDDTVHAELGFPRAELAALTADESVAARPSAARNRVSRIG